MNAARIMLGAALLATLAGCQTAPGPIFSPVQPPLVWPAPPDPPRIRYVGELRGEASLGARPSGWEALRAALGGPRPMAEFVRPSAVAVAGQRIFVADIGAGVVHLLDLEQRRYATLRGAPDDPLRVPVDLAVAGERVLVVDRARAALDVLNLDGAWQGTQRWPEITQPVAAAWDAGGQRIWIADVAAHAVFCISCPAIGVPGGVRNTEYSIQNRIGGRGSAPGQFNYPRALAAQPSIGLAVVDAMNFRVQILDADGTPAGAFGRKGDAAGDFAQPRGVAVDSAGHLYVTDNQFENVQVFDRAGRLLLAFGQGGARPGEFSLPAGLAIDAQDRIWIADSYNRRVQVFQYLAEEAQCAP